MLPKCQVLHGWQIIFVVAITLKIDPKSHSWKLANTIYFSTAALNHINIQDNLTKVSNQPQYNYVSITSRCNYTIN